MRTPPAVVAIDVAVDCDEVALLEGDADEDVARGREREHEPADGHVRRRPEGHQQAQIDRVADELVDERGAEARIDRFATAPDGEDL